MKKTRRILMSALLLGAAAMLTACGGNDNKGTTDKVDHTNEDIVKDEKPQTDHDKGTVSGELGDVARDIGNGAGDIVEDTGKTVKNAVEDTGKAVKNAAKDTGRAVKDAARDTKNVEKNTVNEK